MGRRLGGLVRSARDGVDRVARTSPARLTVAAFLALLAVFTLLLSQPFATASGRRAPFADAVFTAASAVSVTGLTTVPTGSYWSTGGQVVILVAVQVGGLGVMTLASLLGLVVAHRIGLTRRLLAAAETGTSRLGEVGSLVRLVVTTSLVIELALLAALLPRFRSLGAEWGEATWHATFYAVSAFNNAGFAPTDDALAPFADDWWVGLPLILGVFIGSLGFPVIYSLTHGWRRLALHAKLTLVTSGALVVVGVVAFAALEWTNPATLGPLDGSSRALASLYAGVMPRSGGFAVVDVAALRESTWLVTDALMFVGGGSASTAGGIKVTTLAVLVLAIVAEARGNRDIEVYGRRIPLPTVRLAVAVAFLGATLVLVTSLALLQVTDAGLDVVLFETISAFSTTGLSTGLSPTLPESGKYWLAALMFVGRTGTMTVAAALAMRERRRVVRFPEERPVVG